jgi:hypothetical protein
MVALTEGEIRIADLQREVEMAEGSVRNYTDRLEQARLDQELRSKNISNLNVVQPASYMEKPVGLPRLVLLFACFMLGFMGSAGILMIPELRRWFSPPEEFSNDDLASSTADEPFYLEPRESRSNAPHPYEQQELEPVAEDRP